MKLGISSSAAEAILAHARADHPREACGLLVGRSGQVTRIVPADNVAARPHAIFEIDPATLLRVHREVRASGEVVLGHYHSHPNGRAEPSRADAARAVTDGQVWVIAANDALTAWTMTAEDFAAVELA
ncbi:Mov34/MPN/PAD-1 family protein [Glacieibacterium frigidum]|uniref:M67 family metallopeptidase n=1 Tax=Glacieibacterium frigidum TaxID=2593303 RepID=A0A552U8K7_9SPHN|nr:M67 family metallopeptidase [Glacieibacterium frigidum]TRW14553.1 M67 family metallopeptidase [Glacieibacterium frigidum]